MTIFKICNLCCVVFEAIIIWKYFSALFTEKINRYITLVIIFSVYTFNLFILYNDSSIINSIVFSLTNILICRFLYNSNLKQSIFHSVITMVLMIGTEILTLMVCSFIFGSTKITFNQSLSIACFSIISKFLYFISLQLLLFVYKGKKDVGNCQSRFIWYLWITPLSTILLYFTLTDILLSFKFAPLSEYLLLIILILFLFANVFIFISYHANQQLNIQCMETQAELQKEKSNKQFYKLFEEQNENQKILIHDIRKHLDVIRNMVRTSNNTDLENYINEIDKSSALQENIVFCDNHTLNLILGRYYILFAKNNISFSFYIEPNSFDNIQISDITSLFSNLFENAYEAAVNSENAYIDFSVKHSQEDSQIIIKMINTYLVEPKKTSDNVFSTTKSDEIYHGFGIKSIKKVVDKYKGIYNFYTDQNDKTFHVNLMLSNIYA